MQCLSTAPPQKPAGDAFNYTGSVGRHVLYFAVYTLQVSELHRKDHHDVFDLISRRSALCDMEALYRETLTMWFVLHV